MAPIESEFNADLAFSGTIDYGVMAGRTMLLAELASCQMEYKYLSKLTGRPEYYDKVHNLALASARH